MSQKIQIRCSPSTSLKWISQAMKSGISSDGDDMHGCNEQEVGVGAHTAET